MTCGDFVVEKEIIFGHIARKLAKPTQEKTHHWEIFLYSPTGEDLTRWIEKVKFHLHPSFNPPERTCTVEPYRASEDGWGEFEASIEIYPKDSESFTLMHFISFPQTNSRKPALIERKREKVVFRNPSPILYEGLSSAPFAWNKIKREKKHLPAKDVEVVDIPTSDPNLEIKWTTELSLKSKMIRHEIAELTNKQTEQRNRIMYLIQQIEEIDPDIAEAAKLFL